MVYLHHTLLYEEHSAINNHRKITLGANKNIILEFTDERIIPASGLAVVGALPGKVISSKNLTLRGTSAGKARTAGSK